MADNSARIAELEAEIKRRRIAELEAEIARRNPPGMVNKAISGANDFFLGGENTNLVEQTGTGVNEGIAGTAGWPVDALTGAMNYGLEKFGAAPIEKPIGGSKSLEGLLSPFMSEHEPENESQSRGRSVGRELGSATVTAPLAVAAGAGKMALAGSELAAAGGGELGDWAVEKMGGGEGAQLAGRVVGSLGTGSWAANKLAPTARAPKAQTLLDEGSEAIEAAVARGRNVAPFTMGNLSDRMKRHLISEAKGMTQDGRVKAGFPGLADVFDEFDTFVSTGTPMTPKQTQSIRQTLQDLAFKGGPEGRTGTILLGMFDDAITSQHVPDLIPANKIYAMGKRAETVDNLMEDARWAYGNSGSGGNEINTTAQKARTLLKNIRDGKVGGYSEAERQAIRDVVEPTFGVRTSRKLSALAPSKGGLNAGAVVAGMSGLGGAGLLTGAPTGGATMGLGVAAALSEIAHRTGIKIRRNQIDKISELVRRGGQPAPDNKSLKAILAALMAGEVARPETPAVSQKVADGVTTMRPVVWN